ncbi:MAG: YhgN family NAAT transporter [Verrucomicrobiota bacterium]|nr:YhgN family NAAT transporter [Verrucomicrobiota bacterium]
MKILSIAFSLFLLMDPLGNVPLFLSILKHIPPKRQRIIIARELLIALTIIALFALAGDELLRFLSVDQATVHIAGGIILFLLCIHMIFPSSTPSEPLSAVHEPFFVPLAIPLVAGPGVLAAVMIYAGQEENDWIVLAALFIAWVASLLILLVSPLLQRLLGQRGLVAIERLMGLIVTLIAVQMFLEGIAGFAKQI